MRSFFILFVLFLLMGTKAYSADSLWHFIPQAAIKVEGKRKIIPQQYMVVKLNDSMYNLISRKVPVAGEGEFVILELPSPDGQKIPFRWTQNSTMAKELADKYPELKTYSGEEVDNRTVTAKTDYTVFGFHAMVSDGENTWFIDPYTDKNTGYYICYFKKYYNKPAGEMLKESPVQKKRVKKHKCRRK